LQLAAAGDPAGNDMIVLTVPGGAIAHGGTGTNVIYVHNELGGAEACHATPAPAAKRVKIPEQILAPATPQIVAKYQEIDQAGPGQSNGHVCEHSTDAAKKVSTEVKTASGTTTKVGIRNIGNVPTTANVYFYGAGDRTRDRVPTFNFIYPNSAYDPRRALLGVQTERWVNQMGIPARGVPTGFNVIVTKVFDDVDFDVWSLGWSLGGLTPPDYLEAFFHTRHTEPGDDNPQGYSNPDVDALLDKFLETLDLNTARAIVFQLQEILAADAPYAPAFDTIIVDAWRDDKVVFPFTERMGGMPSLVNLR
jgi:ABC-type transport system substrate-binding protein